MRHLQPEPRAIHLRSPRRAYRQGLSLVWGSPGHANQNAEEKSPPSNQGTGSEILGRGEMTYAAPPLAIWRAMLFLAGRVCKIPARIGLKETGEGSLAKKEISLSSIFETGALLE